MNNQKQEFIYKTGLTVSEKRMMMCLVNHVINVQKEHKWQPETIPLSVPLDWLQYEFKNLNSETIEKKYLVNGFNQLIYYCKKKEFFAELNFQYATFKKSNIDFALTFDEPFTKQDYAECNIKNMEKGLQKPKIKIEKNHNAPERRFWEAGPNAKKDDERKADVYLMAVNILEKLQPMLLNLIYEELAKETVNAP